MAQGRPVRVVWLNTLFLSGAPIAVLVLVPVHLFQVGWSWAPLFAMVTLWMLTGLGITAGYHRLFSHRSYRAHALVRVAYAILGAAAWQQSILDWSSDHRRHHREVDTDGDPYNAKRGFWWSHMGWVMLDDPIYQRDHDNVRDLWADPVCRLQHRWYFPISLGFNLGLPALLGLWMGDVWGMLLYAGLARVVLVHHFTFLINSVAHIAGKQPWSQANTSRDSWWLSLLTFGEGYHNYHHAFESDYRNGPRWYNFDPSKWLIWVLDRLGLAHGLRRTPIEVVLRRRFEEAKEVFATRMEELGQRWEHWRAEPSTEGVRAVDSTSRLVALETRLESGLTELGEARREWQRAMKARTPDLNALRASLRTAQSSVQETLAEWEQVTRDSLQQSMLVTA